MPEGIGAGLLADEIHDVSLWLEFVASQQTQLSLMGLGLLRTTAIAISEFIAQDTLDEQQATQKLRDMGICSLGLPIATEREVHMLAK